MSYQVLARKWRPQTFAEIVGQEHVTTTLTNALAKGRVAHAYLFTGPRGCGKTTMARLLAKALNCDSGPTPKPCGTCPSCAGIATGSFLDVLEIDAASHTGVDNIRELRENAQYQPTAGKKRIFIIDEVHMLSKGAFNALLKTLEEPPPHVHFVFATTEPVRIPRTILSRCQRFDFRLFSLQELRGRLDAILATEDREVDPEAVELLAVLAEGSMRDALSLLDQALSSTEGRLDKAGVIALFGLVGHDRYLALTAAILARDSRAGLDLVDELANAGHDLVEFARGLVGHFRDLLLMRLDGELAARVEKPEAVKKTMSEQAASFEVQDLLVLTQRSAQGYTSLERAPHPRWLLEAQVVEYTRHESQVLLSEILGRLQALAGDEGGAPAGGGSAGKAPRGSTGKSKSKGSGSARSAAASAGPRPAARLEAAPPVKSTPPAPAASAISSAPRDTAGRETTPVEPAPPTAEPVLEPVVPTAERSLLDDYGRFAERARKENIAVGTCLVEAAPRIEGGELLLKFRPEHGFHRDQIAQPKHLSWLAELASSCFGRSLKIRPVTETPDGGEESVRRQVQREVAPTADQELARRTQAHPELGRLIDGLGGKIIDGR